MAQRCGHSPPTDVVGLESLTRCNMWVLFVVVVSRSCYSFIYLFIYFFIIFLFVSISELMRLFAGEHFGEHFSKWIHPSIKECGWVGIPYSV